MADETQRNLAEAAPMARQVSLPHRTNRRTVVLRRLGGHHIRADGEMPLQRLAGLQDVAEIVERVRIFWPILLTCPP